MAVQTIEIKTTQNVSIEYELAGLVLRAVAFGLDVMIQVLSIWFYALIVIQFFNSQFSTPVMLPMILFLIFYTLFFESVMSGKTPGKLVVGIRVVKVDGSRLGFQDLFARWSMRLLDIYFSCGCLAAILTGGTMHGQRLGDMAAGTTVIKSKNTSSFALKDILHLKTLENYTPEYKNASLLSESDVLFIKGLIFRVRKYNNKAHRETLHEAAAKVASILEIHPVPKDKELFLRKIISDYIVLTR